MIEFVLLCFDIYIYIKEQTYLCFNCNFFAEVIYLAYFQNNAYLKMSNFCFVLIFEPCLFSKKCLFSREYGIPFSPVKSSLLSKKPLPSNKPLKKQKEKSDLLKKVLSAFFHERDGWKVFFSFLVKNSPLKQILVRRLCRIHNQLLVLSCTSYT